MTTEVVSDNILDDAIITDLGAMEEEIQKRSEALYELQDVSDKLYKLNVALSDTLASGGINGPLVEMVNLTTKNLLTGTDISPDIILKEGDSIDVSMENASFVNEFLKAAIAKIWQGIKAMIVKLRRLAMTLYHTVFGIHARQIRLANKLMEKVNAFSNMKADAKVSVDIEFLHIGGLYPKDIVRALTDFNGVSRNMCYDYYTGVKAMTMQIIAFMQGIDPSNDETFVRSTVGARSIRTPILPAALTQGGVEKPTERKTPEFLGGKCIKETGAEYNEFVEYSSKVISNYIQQHLAKHNVEVISLSKATGKESIDILQPIEVSQVLTQVINLSDTLLRFKTSFVERERFMDELISIGDNYRNKINRSTGLNEDNTWLAQTCLQLTQIAADNLEKPITGFIGHATKVANAALSLCDKTLTAYSQG